MSSSWRELKKRKVGTNKMDKNRFIFPDDDDIEDDIGNITIEDQNNLENLGFVPGQ